jgi:hypothetical protein
LTPEQHNKYLGISHLVYGGLFFLLMLGMLGFISVMFAAIPSGPNGPPAFFFGFMWVFLGLFYGAMTVPSLIAGYGLLKRKKWAKTASIIAGVMSGMSFPMGTRYASIPFGSFSANRGKYSMTNQPMRFRPLARSGQLRARELKKKLNTFHQQLRLTGVR